MPRKPKPTFKGQERKALFVIEYAKDFNGTQAAIRAGYSKKTAASQASRLLRDVKVMTALAEATKDRIERVGQSLKVEDITADRLYLEAARLAFGDIRGIYNADGTLKPVHEWPDDAAAFVSGVETVDQNLVAGDGKIDRVHKIRRFEKATALKLLFQAKGLLVEKVEHAGEITYKWKD